MEPEEITSTILTFLLFKNPLLLPHFLIPLSQKNKKARIFAKPHKNP